MLSRFVELLLPSHNTNRRCARSVAAGRQGLNAEARCELDLRSDKLELDKSHELESVPKPMELDRRLLDTFETITE